ncbi:hypothetical protein Tco_1120068, partial [Tanacetum coccineum]
VQQIPDGEKCGLVEGSSNFFLTSLRKPKEDLIVILASDTSPSEGGNGGVGVGNAVSGGGGNGGSDGGENGGGVLVLRY